MPSLELQPTNMPAVDEILGGGVPRGSVVVVTGPAGSGKTILAANWLFAGHAGSQEPGLFIAATESVERSQANLSGFKFYTQSALTPKKIHFTDLASILSELNLNNRGRLTDEQLDQVVMVVRNLVDRMQAKRVVFDSITALLYKLEGPDAVRNFIFRLGSSISTLGATVFLISEAGDGPLAHLEEFIADGIIGLNSHIGGNSRVRELEIKKMRGLSYRSGPVIFEINHEGFWAFPKIPSYTIAAETDFADRVDSGIPMLDKLMGGGYPTGHAVMFGGNTGSGKSTFGLQFLAAGIQKNQPVVMVALEESVTQIKKNAAVRGWDFDDWEKQNLLSFVTTNLVDVNPDKLLYDIIHHVQTVGAKRVVIDSISSMESGTFDKHQVREFMLQIAAFFKSRGITCLMTYLTTDMFGSAVGQLLGGTTSNELRLSSIVDGIVLLRYVERDQQVRKLLSVLKMRGSIHDKSIREFSIHSDGIQIGEPFKS